MREREKKKRERKNTNLGMWLKIKLNVKANRHIIITNLPQLNSRQADECVAYCTDCSALITAPVLLRLIT